MHNDEMMRVREMSVRSRSHDFHSRTFLAMDFMTAGDSALIFLYKLMIDQLSNKSQIS